MWSNDCHQMKNGGLVAGWNKGMSMCCLVHLCKDYACALLWLRLGTTAHSVGAQSITKSFYKTLVVISHENDARQDDTKQK